LEKFFFEKKEFSQHFFDIVLKFIENNSTVLDIKDIIKLIDILIDSDNFFIIIFEKMNSLNLNYELDMIHKRIELFF
jgi:hypothetical protein